MLTWNTTRDEFLNGLRNNQWRLCNLKSNRFKNPETNGFSPHPLLNDPEVVRAGVQKCGTDLQFAPSHLKKNKEIVLAAVRRNGIALQYAADDLKGDKDVVLAAVVQDVKAFQYASRHLDHEPVIMLARVQHSPSMLLHNDDVPDDLKNDSSFFWGLWYLPASANDQTGSNLYLNERLPREILKSSIGVIGVVLGGFMIGGVIVFPISAMVTLAIGVCLEVIGAYHMSQHTIGFFNAKRIQDLAHKQNVQPTL
jgi:Domain of unknown function (DUF4116)